MKKFYLSQLMMLLSVWAVAQVTVTFSVDMTGVMLSGNGVYVAGDFQSWSPGVSAYELKDTDGDNIFRLTADVTPVDGKLTFKYVNDNTWGNNETFGAESGDCIVEDSDGNKNRQVEIPAGTTSVELATWVYDSCTESAIATSTKELQTVSGMKVTPNPFSDVAVLTFENTSSERLDLRVTNLMGQVVYAQNDLNSNTVELNRGDLASGVYFASLVNPAGLFATQRIVIQ